MKDSDVRTEYAKKPKSLSRVVEVQVREKILSRELAAGTVVRPEDVGKELGVSQTPAREALQTLKAQGFLISQPGVGFVVAPLTGQDIEDIFTAHALLAGEIAARAVRNADEAATLLSMCCRAQNCQRNWRFLPLNWGPVCHRVHLIFV